MIAGLWFMGKALYFDDDHLSVYGAEQLIFNSVISNHINQTN